MAPAVGGYAQLGTVLFGIGVVLAGTVAVVSPATDRQAAEDARPENLVDEGLQHGDAGSDDDGGALDAAA